MHRQRVCQDGALENRALSRRVAGFSGALRRQGLCRAASPATIGTDLLSQDGSEIAESETIEAALAQRPRSAPSAPTALRRPRSAASVGNLDLLRSVASSSLRRPASASNLLDRHSRDCFVPDTKGCAAAGFPGKWKPVYSLGPGGEKDAILRETPWLPVGVGTRSMKKKNPFAESPTRQLSCLQAPDQSGHWESDEKNLENESKPAVEVHWESDERIHEHERKRAVEVHAQSAAESHTEDGANVLPIGFELTGEVQKHCAVDTTDAEVRNVQSLEHAERGLSAKVFAKSVPVGFGPSFTVVGVGLAITAIGSSQGPALETHRSPAAPEPAEPAERAEPAEVSAPSAPAATEWTEPFAPQEWEAKLREVLRDRFKRSHLQARVAAAEAEHKTATQRCDMKRQLPDRLLRPVRSDSRLRSGRPANGDHSKHRG